MYAVNIADWQVNQSDFGLAILLQPVTQARQIVETERRRFDGMGIVLDCDDGRGTAIVEIIRKQYKRYQLRLYHSKTGKGNWKRV